MTTVAWKGNVLAADTMATNLDNNLRSKVTKLHRLPGRIIGFAGDIQSSLRFIEWMQLGDRNAKKPRYKFCEFDAIELNAEGAWLWDHDFGAMKIENNFYAIGSGAPVAIGAMEMGASPLKAIHVAAKWDANTGGNVISLKLNHRK